MITRLPLTLLFSRYINSSDFRKEVQVKKDPLTLMECRVIRALGRNGKMVLGDIRGQVKYTKWGTLQGLIGKGLVRMLEEEARGNSCDSYELTDKGQRVNALIPPLNPLPTPLNEVREQVELILQS